VPVSAATYQTGAWLLKSLQGPLPAARVNEPEQSQGDGVCKDRNDVVFGGTWRSLRIEHCANVRIENATLGQLVVIRSRVSLENVTIASQGTALEATRGNIVATGLRIVAPRAWRLDDSRLDLAAFDINARELGIEKDDSLLYLSLGHWCDGVDEWRLHGVWKTRSGKLEPQFRKTRAGSCTASSNTLNPPMNKGTP